LFVPPPAVGVLLSIITIQLTISPEPFVENMKVVFVALPSVKVKMPSVKVKDVGVILAFNKFAGSGAAICSDPVILSAVVYGSDGVVGPEDWRLAKLFPV